jgi:predicted nucleic acid-binding protein
MAWVVDTCLVLDVLDADPLHGPSSAALLDRHASDGLTVCPVTYIELAPAFDGDHQKEEFFLRQINVDWRSEWTRADTENAHAAWARYVERKRKGKGPSRPLADIQIGAFAERHQGLLTRNKGDFRPVFPSLVIRP